MKIPHDKLTAAALQAIVSEFVTRDGTDHSPIDARIERVMGQLASGIVELHFDTETETCNIIEAKRR